MLSLYNIMTETKYEPIIIAEYGEVSALLKSGKTGGYGQCERAQSQGGVNGRKAS